MAARARPVTPVGILADTLDSLCARAEQVDGLDEAFLTELRRARGIAGGFEPYVACCTTRESPALAELARRTRDHDWSDRAGAGVAVALEQEMLSGHVEGMLLRFLVRLTRARAVLEIGMFTGYSALAIAQALPEDGRVVACELDQDVAAFAQDAFDDSPSGERIEVRGGPALTTLGELADAGERFDLVFLDADKAGYVDYVSAVLDDDLLAPGGLVCVDNTLMQGEPWLPDEPSANGAAITTFNATIAGDPRVEQVLLAVRDGLTLIQRV